MLTGLLHNRQSVVERAAIRTQMCTDNNKLKKSKENPESFVVNFNLLQKT